MSKSPKIWIFTAAVITTLGLLGTSAAYAIATFRSGSTTTRQYFLDETDAYTVPVAGSWQTLPSASIAVNVPAGNVRLINVRFNAESLCGGPGWCSVRVTYTTPSGATVELGPQSGTDFAFDSDGDMWDAHAIERTSRTYVGPGNYVVQVQAQRVAGATTFRLDDYATTVGLVAP